MSIDPTIARAYWDAVTADSAEDQEFPELGEDPIESLLALLAGAKEDDETAFHRDEEPLENPYQGIAVAEDPALELEVWAAAITGLIPLSCAKLQDYVLHVDTVIDADGNHRVYPFVDGMPAEDMASLDDALRWMTAVVKHSRGLVKASAVADADALMSTPSEWLWSGAEVFCHLRDLPLHAAYQAWSVRSWPEFDIQSISHIKPDEPAAARLAMIVEVEQVLRSKRLARRHASLRMDDAQGVLLDHLKDLTASVIGERAPQVVVDAAEGDNPELAELGRAWLARFEAASAVVQPEETSAQIAIRSAISETVDSLTSKGSIEVAEGARELLVEDLTLAAFDAGNPRIVLKKLRSSLLHSDHVEEVYVNDLEIETAFRSALGG